MPKPYVPTTRAIRRAWAMTWLTIGRLFLEIVSRVAGYLRDKQLLDAGEAKATAKYSGDALEKVHEANGARVSAADGGVFIDPYDRANRRGVPDAPSAPVRQPGDTG